MILVVGMGVAKDIVATVSNLAYWMAKERTTDSLRELSKLKRLLPDQAVEEAEETFDAMEMFLKEGQFDDAWEQFEVLADIVMRYTEDPPKRDVDTLANKVLEDLYKLAIAIHEERWEDVSLCADKVVNDYEKFLKAKFPEDKAFVEARVEEAAAALYPLYVIAKEEKDIYKAAWEFLDLFTSIAGVLLDPPLTTWLPEETYEEYEKAAKIVGETKSRYAREVLEGRRIPVEPPNGIRAKERAERIAKPERKADWEVTIEEAEKPVEPDWMKTLRKVLEGEE
ncbi:MAG: hypothetical protein ACXQTW_07365 [Candidatus Methanospirareceae archaeon]